MNNYIAHVQKEVAALQRIGSNLGAYGQRISRAFGESQPWEVAQDQGPRHWLFEIRLNHDSEKLESIIDIYMATTQLDAEFDVGAWTDQLIEIGAPASRLGFRALSQASRAVLGGRKLILNSATLHFPALAKQRLEGLA
ncbi:hypothetical protein C4K10_1921 [Pseudomonas chlororaphis subsp. aureofaciens]|uniref:hypothetical protein n=1 Tax=Pseudomonas chlororaphis TaxID=587753 RepID=UPI000F5810D2|nr:hypothetical protein [Pseudomonas chlororaphis]AZE10211.1 hypothetical protein C4K10_1921 [Pseudomonas chlororaphis subsp. aureofaciens]